LKDGVTPEELDSARKGLLESWKVGRSDDASLSAIIHSGLPFGRTTMWLAALEKRIETVTVADVNRALRRFIRPDRMIVLKAGDFANAKQPDIAPAMR
jgi:zinc protease